jgi:predicted RNase H-like nuclease (RuvC/YqgF family)
MNQPIIALLFFLRPQARDRAAREIVQLEDEIAELRTSLQEEKYHSKELEAAYDALQVRGACARHKNAPFSPSGLFFSPVSPARAPSLPQVEMGKLKSGSVSAATPAGEEVKYLRRENTQLKTRIEEMETEATYRVSELSELALQLQQRPAKVGDAAVLSTCLQHAGRRLAMLCSASRNTTDAVKRASLSSPHRFCHQLHRKRRKL